MSHYGAIKGMQTEDLPWARNILKSPVLAMLFVPFVYLFTFCHTPGDFHDHILAVQSTHCISPTEEVLIYSQQNPESKVPQCALYPQTAKNPPNAK